MPKREFQPLRIGYARVSTHDQNLEIELDALKKTGCKRIFTDKLSGAQVERPGLNEALSQLRQADTLVVWKLDRLGRSVKGLVDLVILLVQRGGRPVPRLLREAARQRRHQRVRREHRGELPMSEYAVALDQPEHQAQRGLIMRVFTPKRMKENEAFMYGLADRLIDEYLPSGTIETQSGLRPRVRPPRHRRPAGRAGGGPATTSGRT